MDRSDFRDPNGWCFCFQHQLPKLKCQANVSGFSMFPRELKWGCDWEQMMCVHVFYEMRNSAARWIKEQVTEMRMLISIKKIAQRPQIRQLQTQIDARKHGAYASKLSRMTHICSGRLPNISYRLDFKAQIHKQECGRLIRGLRLMLNITRIIY